MQLTRLLDSQLTSARQASVYPHQSHCTVPQESLLCASTIHWSALPSRLNPRSMLGPSASREQRYLDSSMPVNGGRSRITQALLQGELQYYSTGKVVSPTGVYVTDAAFCSTTAGLNVVAAVVILVPSIPIAYGNTLTVSKCLHRQRDGVSRVSAAYST